MPKEAEFYKFQVKRPNFSRPTGSDTTVNTPFSIELPITATLKDLKKKITEKFNNELTSFKIVYLGRVISVLKPLTELSELKFKKAPEVNEIYVLSSFDSSHASPETQNSVGHRNAREAATVRVLPASFLFNQDNLTVRQPAVRISIGRAQNSDLMNVASILGGSLAQTLEFPRMPFLHTNDNDNSGDSSRASSTNQNNNINNSTALNGANTNNSTSSGSSSNNNSNNSSNSNNNNSSNNNSNNNNNNNNNSSGSSSEENGNDSSANAANNSSSNTTSNGNNESVSRNDASYENSEDVFNSFLRNWCVERERPTARPHRQSPLNRVSYTIDTVTPNLNIENGSRFEFRTNSSQPTINARSLLSQPSYFTSSLVGNPASSGSSRQSMTSTMPGSTRYSPLAGEQITACNPELFSKVCRSAFADITYASAARINEPNDQRVFGHNFDPAKNSVKELAERLKKEIDKKQDDKIHAIENSEEASKLKYTELYNAAYNNDKTIDNIIELVASVFKKSAKSFDNNRGRYNNRSASIVNYGPNKLHRATELVRSLETSATLKENNKDPLEVYYKRLYNERKRNFSEKIDNFNSDSDLSITTLTDTSLGLASVYDEESSSADSKQRYEENDSSNDSNSSFNDKTKKKSGSTKKNRKVYHKSHKKTGKEKCPNSNKPLEYDSNADEGISDKSYEISEEKKIDEIMTRSLEKYSQRKRSLEKRVRKELYDQQIQKVREIISLFDMVKGTNDYYNSLLSFLKPLISGINKLTKVLSSARNSNNVLINRLILELENADKNLRTIEDGNFKTKKNLYDSFRYRYENDLGSLVNNDESNNDEGKNENKTANDSKSENEVSDAPESLTPSHKKGDHKKEDKNPTKENAQESIITLSEESSITFLDSEDSKQIIQERAKKSVKSKGNFGTAANNDNYSSKENSKNINSNENDENESKKKVEDDVIIDESDAHEQDVSNSQVSFPPSTTTVDNDFAAHPAFFPIPQPATTRTSSNNDNNNSFNFNVNDANNEANNDVINLGARVFQNIFNGALPTVNSPATNIFRDLSRFLGNMAQPANGVFTFSTSSNNGSGGNVNNSNNSNNVNFGRSNNNSNNENNSNNGNNNGNGNNNNDADEPDWDGVD